MAYASLLTAGRAADRWDSCSATRWAPCSRSGGRSSRSRPAIAIFKYRLYDIDVVISKTIVYGSLAAFITLVYVVIVVGIGSLGPGFLRAGSRPDLGLSIVATAVVAVAFQPVRERAQRLANRLVFGKRATPYEALSEFAGRMGGTYAADDVLPRMAQVLAEGTGASRAVVWLRDGAELAGGA